MEFIVSVIVFAVIMAIAILVALIPFFIANYRDHRYRWVILVLCLFAPAGIPWLIAMVWAVWPQDRSALSPIASPTGKE